MQNATTCSTRDSAIFFPSRLFVLVPQVWRNFRHRTVVGISCGWAIANFTAALNNTFFVIKSGNMPWYLYGYIYMPVIDVSIIAICKSLDFMQTYLLIMPIQYTVMAFFSSTVSQVGTLQVIWYWNQQPVEEKSDVIESNVHQELKVIERQHEDDGKTGRLRVIPPIHRDSSTS
ncbi:hypothetical protein M3Y96_01012500 [Aphelenchoides besseyi]|nr:hypothetical protein M3Y96_01012500 [Aphelenchoides besseyi]